MSSPNWISWQSPYFAKLGLCAETDAPLVTQLIKAGQEHIETFCGRVFAQQQFDEIAMVKQDGSVVLRNPPVDSINRISVARGTWLTLGNTTAVNPTLATNESQLDLAWFENGIRQYATATWAAFPTLTELATAINDFGQGWNASVIAGYGSYPSSDIVANQFATAGQATTLMHWEDDIRQFRMDKRLGIIPGFSGQYETSYQMMTYQPLVGGPMAYLLRGDEIRVAYVGGYVAVPEDLKMVLSHLVITGYESPTGRKQQEMIGNQYSYSLMDIDKMPASDRKILGTYRNRWV